MRPPSLGSVASYGTVVAITTAEGTLQFMVPPYLEQAGYPLAWTGVLYGLPFGVALLCRLPAGLLYRGERARLLVALAAATNAVSALLLPLAPGPLAVFGLQVLHGAAFGLGSTVTLAHFLGTHGSGAGRTRAMSYYATALSGGYMLGNGASGLIAAQWGYGVGLASAGLWALGGAALAWALPPVVGLTPAAPPPAQSRWSGARRALGDPGLLYASAVAFLLNLLYHTPGGFFALYGLSAGLGVAEVGFVRTAFAFTNTAVRGFCGRVLERIGRTRAQTAGVVLQALGLAAVPLFDTFLPLLACLVFAAVWRGVGLVANTVALAEDVDPRRVSRGVASGVYSAAADVGGLAAPALGGLVGQVFGLDSVFRVLPGLAVLVYVLATVTVGRAGRPAAPHGAPAEPTRT
jgi:MFS family permease